MKLRPVPPPPPPPPPPLSGEHHFPPPPDADAGAADAARALHRRHRAALARAREDGVRVTVHAGESGPSANVLAAVSEYGASRVGHGYRVVELCACRARISARVARAHFEVCPTSSHATGGWVAPGAEPDWSRHPARAMLDAGLSLSLSSDDPALFGTTLAREHEIAVSKIGVSAAELEAMTLAAIDAAFDDDADGYLAEMRGRVRAFYAQHAFVL